MPAGSGGIPVKHGQTVKLMTVLEIKDSFGCVNQREDSEQM